MLFKTFVTLPDGQQATVETVDWNAPGYEVCGYESVTTLPYNDEDGEKDSWGIGPERDDDTPLSLHMSAVWRLAQSAHVGLTEWNGMTA